MSDIIKLTATLVIISIAAGLAIAFTNGKTADKIAVQKLQAEQKALKSVFPEGSEISVIENDTIIEEKYWTSSKGGKLTGYAFKGSSRGFSSDIEFIAGVDPNGKILGLVILAQAETPGLGTRIEEIVSKKYIWNVLSKNNSNEKATPWFTEQFRGVTVREDIEIDKSGEWHSKSEEDRNSLIKRNAVSALTGATISTKAVIAGVKKVCGENLGKIYKNAESEAAQQETSGIIPEEETSASPEMHEVNND